MVLLSGVEDILYVDCQYFPITLTLPMAENSQMWKVGPHRNEVRNDVP